eukprot:CAMPEP_0184687756 /NCGR_PEP_ID=MMETSP0312-20130426/27481_1 /TAXON_ID=31354 /ORGANISM="Compsopogon coeruleus, Strain SAG 36.94" /LENGTH=125 /DNA_ID=CAMNT_0027144223 /DNA_START=155 /DNA_END=528 /DNA_ORIENTATION=+
MIQSFHPQNPRKLSLHETPPTSMNGRTQSVSGGDWNLASCPTHCPGFMTRETRLEKAVKEAAVSVCFLVYGHERGMCDWQLDGGDPSLIIQRGVPVRGASVSSSVPKTGPPSMVQTRMRVRATLE